MKKHFFRPAAGRIHQVCPGGRANSNIGRFCSTPAPILEHVSAKASKIDSPAHVAAKLQMNQLLQHFTQTTEVFCIDSNQSVCSASANKYQALYMHTSGAPVLEILREPGFSAFRSGAFVRYLISFFRV